MNKQEQFCIDGYYFDVLVLKIKRKFVIQDTEKAGRSKSGRMHRDIIGTYYNYIIELDMQRMSRADYDLFYNVISSPQESHMIKMPYGQETIEFEAYVSSGDDTLRVDKGKGNYWSGLSITFTAMEPQRRP